ncbi:MAG: ROK family protein [Prevotellaceae bacterium]|jgi:glucokinase|nr:ROK family protein [Prevotellaceae bacterium]
MDTKKLVVGIDIGGTNTKFGMVDRIGNIYVEENISTPQYKNFDDYVNALKDVIVKLEKEVENAEIIGIGIGAPNGNHNTGTIAFAPNLPWKGVLPIVASLQKFFPSICIVLDNDANAAAIGEMVYGGAAKMRDFLFVTLGTGVGSGFVANGEMIYGHDGLAGELGHVIVEKNGRECGCGRCGCLETYTSAPGVKRTVWELLSKSNEESVFRNKRFDEFETKNIAEAAEKGDKIAIETFQITGEILGLALANAVAITVPEAIFLFGGLAKAGNLIFEPTIASFEKNVLKFWKNKIKILPSELQNKDVSILGSASLAWNSINRGSL